MQQVTDDDAQVLRDMRKKLQNIRAVGMDLQNTPDGITIGPPHPTGGGAISDDLPPAIVKLIGTAPGAGWYTAKIWIPPSAASDPTADLVESALGTAGNDCFVANSWEVGLSGHMLAASGVLPLIVFATPLPSASDGTPCFMIATDQYEDCSD